jgi:2',3'-cyclic-nucleotide 2'-phosphodiesterase/3'-nucleotidase
MRRAAVVAFAAFLAAARVPAVVLTILHTSDLHGRVHPHDALADADLGEGLARVAAAVKAARAEGHPTLLLDSGDAIEGSPTQALAFAGRLGSGGGGDPIIRAMNLLGYDAMAVGNHEFDFGLQRLNASRKEARFPFLSANTLGADGEPAFPPYAVLEAGGVRVGVLGLVTPHVANWESPANVAGLRFGDSVQAARRWVPVLRGREHCALVIVLAHEGFERDPHTGKSRPDSGENQAYAIATEVPGIDLLLSGHAHAVVAPTRLGRTWVSQPGRWGNTLTRFDVTLEKSGGSWTIAAARGWNLSMKHVVPDPEIVAAIAPEHDATMSALAGEVAVLEAPASASGARRRDTELLDWLHAVQLREGRAVLSFASLLPRELPEWAAGPLTFREIWRFYPYENDLVTVEATGRQVRAALERAAGCVGRMEEFGRNCDSLEGADYVLDLSRPEGRRVTSLTRNGRDIGDDETFLVPSTRTGRRAAEAIRCGRPRAGFRRPATSATCWSPTRGRRKEFASRPTATGRSWASPPASVRAGLWRLRARRWSPARP